MDTDISDFFQKAIEQTPESIFLINAAGTIIFAAQELNKKFEGKTFLKAVSKSHHKRVRKAINDAFSSKRAANCEFKGGIGVSHSAWFSCRISPVLKNGETSSALVFASDITKLRAQNLGDKKKTQKKPDKARKNAESEQGMTQDRFEPTANQSGNSQLEDMLAVDEKTISVEKIDLMLKDESLKKAYEKKFKNQLLRGITIIDGAMIRIN